MHIGKQKAHFRAFCVLALPALIITLQRTAVAQASTGTQGQTSLETLAKELDNPVSKIWSLVFQNHLNLQEGKAVDESAVANNFVFQPALPFPLGSTAVFISRPVFPIPSWPVVDSAPPGVTTDRNAGIGGIQLLTRVGVTMPVRVRIEAQYSVVRPEAWGTRWNFRFRAVPVIRSPFAK